MSRYKGSYIISTYDTNKRFPLDARMLVSKYSDLINPDIWKCSGQQTGDALFDGLLTVVTEQGYRGLYCLTNRQAITSDNYNRYLEANANKEDVSMYFNMWDKFASDVQLEEILNELQQNYTTKEYVDDAMDSISENISANLDTIVEDKLASGSFDINAKSITYGEF